MCEKCGREIEIGLYPFCKGNPLDHGAYRQTHGDSAQYPFVTKNFNGKPIEVRDPSHHRALMKEHGVVQRDDVGWVEKEYLGYNPKTKKQEYKEGSGMGLPGCWF